MARAIWLRDAERPDAPQREHLHGRPFTLLMTSIELRVEYRGAPVAVEEAGHFSPDSLHRDRRPSTSLGNAPFGNWRCWTEAIDRALSEAAIQVVEFSFNKAAHLGRLTHCAEIQQ